MLTGVLNHQLQLAAEGLGIITRGQHSITGNASRIKRSRLNVKGGKLF
jgi:hypothetical protein